MNEPIKLPPGSKMYYRNSDSEEWKELGDLNGVDMAEIGADRTFVSQLMSMNGVTTHSGQMDKEAHAWLLKKLGIHGEPPAPDTATLRKHTEKFRERPKGIPATARHLAGRNDPCPCGSGRKYKKCHLGN